MTRRRRRRRRWLCGDLLCSSIARVCVSVSVCVWWSLWSGPTLIWGYIPLVPVLGGFKLYFRCSRLRDGDLEIMSRYTSGRVGEWAWQGAGTSESRFFTLQGKNSLRNRQAQWCDLKMWILKYCFEFLRIYRLYPWTTRPAAASVGVFKSDSETLSTTNRITLDETGPLKAKWYVLLCIMSDEMY